MKFRGMEDRLNPIAPEGVDESTLGGYSAVHGRAPGFEGSDGAAYTVAIEAERADDGSGDWVAYLVFLRWADQGSAIMGHLETEDVARGASADGARVAAETMALAEVKELLEETIRARRVLDAEE